MIDFKYLFNKTNENREKRLKREIIKTMIVTKIIQKSNKTYWIHLFNNYNIEKIKIDICFEQVREKKAILYKILNNEEDIKGIKQKLEKVFIPFFNKVEYKLIILNNVGDSFGEIEEYVDEII